MYDMINGRSIQCFFEPSGINDITLTIEYKTTRRKLEVDKKVPYKSLVYNYTEDFIIFDYENYKENMEQAWVHIVEEGICKYFVPTEILDEHYPILLVVNKYGIPLKVSSPPDFWALQKDYITLIKNIAKIKQEKLPDAEKRIRTQERMFQLKWEDYGRLPQINSNIVGIALSILAVNKDYDIKPRLERYCQKYEIDLNKAIVDYVAWANLHNLDITIKEVEEVLC